MRDYKFDRTGSVHNEGDMDEGRTSIFKRFEFKRLAVKRYTLDGALSHAQAESKFHRKVFSKVSHPCQGGFRIRHLALWKIEIHSLSPDSCP